MKTQSFLSSIKHGSLVLLILLISCKNEERNVKIAFNLPLSGELATYGVSVRDGVRLALEDITNNTGESYSIDFQDNAGVARNAITIFQRQKTQGYDFYVSGVKPQTMAIIDNVSKEGKPHFVWIFDAFVTTKFDNTYRTWVNYKYEPQYYLKYVDQIKPQKIAIVYVNLPHTVEEFEDILIPELRKRSIENILVEQYSIDKTDFKDIATKLRQFEPDLIILNGFKGNLIQSISAFNEYDLIKEGNTICTYDFLDASEDLSVELKEGIRFIAPRFETRETSKKTNDFKKRFRERFLRNPRYTDAYAYDMMMIINQVNLISQKEGKAFSENIKNTTYEEGVTGLIKFDNTGDIILELDIAYYNNGILKYEIFE